MPRLTLETFPDEGEPAIASAGPSPTDEARMAGFDAGYAAGWEDAAAAHAQERALAEAKATEALQTLGFTYQEARTHVLSAMEPLLHEIAARLLPRMAQAVLPAVVVETIMPLAERLSEPPVTLRLHPDSRAAVERHCAAALGLPVTLIEDSALSPGEIGMTLDTAEARVDLDAAVAAISAAITDFFHPEPEALAHAR